MGKLIEWEERVGGDKGRKESRHELRFFRFIRNCNSFIADKVEFGMHKMVLISVARRNGNRAC